MSLLEGRARARGPPHLWGKFFSPYEVDVNGHPWYLFGKASPIPQLVFPVSGLLCSSSLCIREANSLLGVANVFPTLGPDLGRPEHHGDEAPSGHSDAARSGGVAPKSTTINLACKLGRLVAASPLLLPKELLPATTSSVGDGRAMPA